MDEKDVNIPYDVLSDLCSRFIINVPEEERTDLIRIFFQIEIAHWFYLDFYCDNAQSSITVEDDSENLIQQQPSQQLLRPCSIKKFAEKIFRHCPFLMQHSDQVDEILSRWKEFKHAVPTNGAIILDESMRYVLLVQGFWAKASWGFPKGKVVEEESEAKCAQREVLEETGYDITPKIVDDQYLEITINEQVIRLYIITNVPKTTKFEPKTRREIKEVRWFAIDELPIHRKDIRTKQTLGYTPNSFFMVIPFIKSLKQWISNHQPGKSLNKSSNSSGHRSHNNLQRHNSINSNTNSQHHNNHHHSHHGHHHHHHNNNSNSTGHMMSQHNSVYQFNNLSNDSINGGSGAKHHNHHGHQKKISKSNENLHSISFKANGNHGQKSSNGNTNGLNGSSILINSKSFNVSSPNTNNNSISNQIGNSATGSGKKTRTRTKNAFLRQNSSNGKMSNSISVTDDLEEKRQQHQSQVLTAKQQQSHYFQKLNREELADLNSVRDNHSNSTGSIYNNSRKTNRYSNNSISQTQKFKKHLDFKGPECWTNFKFNYDFILKTLPPVIEIK